MQVGDLLQHKRSRKFFIYLGHHTPAYITVASCQTGVQYATPIREYVVVQKAVL